MSGKAGPSTSDHPLLSALHFWYNAGRVRLEPDVSLAVCPGIFPCSSLSLMKCGVQLRASWQLFLVDFLLSLGSKLWLVQLPTAEDSLSHLPMLEVPSGYHVACRS